VGYGVTFVKVQESSKESPLLLYDQIRAINFYYYPSQRGYDDVRARALAETATIGKKTYLSEASLLTMTSAKQP